MWPSNWYKKNVSPSQTLQLLLSKVQCEQNKAKECYCQSTHRFCVRWTRSLQLLWKTLNVVIYLTNEWYFFLLSYNLFFPVEQSKKELLPLGGHGVDQTALNPLFSNLFQLALLVFWGILRDSTVLTTNMVVKSFFTLYLLCSSDFPLFVVIHVWNWLHKEENLMPWRTKWRPREITLRNE